MSTTQTSHEPDPEELARATADPRDHPGTADGHDDDAHAGETLGPVDARAWAALALGLAAGLLVALCLVITTVLLRSATPVS